MSKGKAKKRNPSSATKSAASAKKGAGKGKGKGNAALRARKRSEFEKEGIGTSKRSWVIAAAVGFSLLAAVAWGLNASSSSSGPPAFDRVAITGPQDYSKGNVEMATVSAGVANGEITVPVADLKKNRLLYFKYEKDGVSVPLMAMITPSGKLYAASSMCEPCRSDKFHTEPDGTLTCNACGTKWDLETLKGISGGCPNFPPQEMKSKVRGDKIVIQETDVRAWKPRTV